MKKEDLLLSKLTAYNETQICPLHMPGHKRQADLDFFREFPNPYEIDITEIHGFDNLHHPEGILKESMLWATNIYGSDKSFYLVNGSTGGILSAISAATNPGDKILLGRNAHKSAYHGVILKQLDPVYIYPQIIEDLGIQGGISPADVERELEADEDIKVVFLVSPTYDGIVSDIKAIREIVHKHGGVLIVDEAHGAHFSFGSIGTNRKRIFPESALDRGADIVIQSLHKTLPSFTQTGILHVKSKRVDLERLKFYLQIYESSSPSYIFLAGIERCIFQMRGHQDELINDFSMRLMDLRKVGCELKHLKLLGNEAGTLIGQSAVFDYDPSKLVISARNCVMDGAKLYETFRQEYGLEMEMCGADYVVAIITCYDSEKNLNRLKQALLDLDKKMAYKESGIPLKSVVTKGEKSLLPWQAETRNFNQKKLEECTGEISAEFIYLYPPGIPIVVPGERISGEILDLIAGYKKMKLPVQGMADEKAEYLRVVDE